MPAKPLILDQDYTIDTPENVSFTYDIAGIGNRFIGALIDTLIVACLLLILNILLFVVLSWDDAPFPTTALDSEKTSWLEGLMIALFVLLQFIIFWGYYTLFEYLWSGQTPGKRLVKIRVLRLDGNPIGFVEAFLRNLVRPIDFLPSGYGLGLVVMFFNERTRRLGDWAAGTVVVRMRADLSLDSLVAPAVAKTQTADQAGPLLLEFPSIRRLSDGDYELIRELLTRKQTGAVADELILRLAQAIALQMEKPAPTDTVTSVQFLRAVINAYRNSSF
jgi:uncharacterized RDD family membrane protein YckC